mmetsp:Transcript_3201/g.6107  ORF Transcript_3201/g.6107 Transcript_3201/m.6107 type:complete len:400 (-) Transcript_3201:154-1353(-)
MCCCCPAAVNALFCLWCQSGCRQGTVAGALTFFPPDPPLYQFERWIGDRQLGESEEAKPEQEKAKNDMGTTGRSSSDSPSTAPEDCVEIESPAPPGGPEHLEETETKGQTQEQMKSPIQQLTDQAAERRKRAKIRNARDARDAAAGVSYRLALDPRLSTPPYESQYVTALKIRNKQGAHCAAIIYKVPPAQCNEQTKTIIYSHGNATDIGAMFPMQVVLVHALNCHVVMYDYSGYGASGGVPEEASTYADMDAVFDYVVKKTDLVAGDASRVILYGQSVGSGPCCYLAARHDQIGGMILHSAFTSGMRVLTASRLLGCLDIYPNIDRIKHVNCPVMILHGRLDQEVDISHGRDLYRATPEEFQRDPWWVPDRGHNDITDGSGKLAEYVRRLRAFLTSLD